MRLVRWILGFLVTLVVLVLAAIVIVPMVFDPNDYREEITQLVKDQTGRELRLDGELEVSVFPWLGIRTQGLALAQPDEIGGDMVSVDNAQLRVKFSPLLSKQVHIDTIVLNKPALRLVTLKNGVDSFAGLGGDETETEEVSDSETDAAGAAVALVVQGIELTDGSLLIDDRAAGTSTEISDLNLVTGNLLGDSLADIEASGVMKSSDSPDDTRFSLDGQGQIDIDTLLVKLANIKAQVTQGELGLNAGFDSLTFTDTVKLSIDGLSADVSGPASAKLQAKSITANMDTQQADIPNLNLSTGDMTANINNLAVRKFIDAPRATGSIDVPNFDASKLIKDFEVDYQTTDPNALKSVGLKADFEGNLEGAGVKGLVVTLDESQLTGSASVANFEKPSAKFDLALNTLNLDRYLPPTTEEEVVEEEPASGAEALAIPMAVFKEINANGQFKAKQLIASGLSMNDIDIQVRSTLGSVTITPTASLYDGSLDGQIAYLEEGGKQSLKVKNKVDLVELGKMLNAADVTDQLSGIGSLLIDLVVTEVDGVQSNNGVIKLVARDGAVQGVDIKGMIDGAYAKYQSLSGAEPSGDEQGQTDKNDETKFAELLGTFNVNNNVITNDDFSMKAPLFRVGGEGTIDVEKQVLDYLVEVKIVASTDGQGGEAMEKLAGIPIPIRFTGSLTEPNYSIDFKRMYKALLARRVDEKKGELLREKLGVEGGEDLSTKDVLKGFLGRKLDKSDGKPEERPLTERGSESPEALEKAKKDQQKDELKNKLLDGLFGK